jgi:hypothetical protein
LTIHLSQDQKIPKKSPKNEPKIRREKIWEKQNPRVELAAHRLPDVGAAFRRALRRKIISVQMLQMWISHAPHAPTALCWDTLSIEPGYDGPQ